MAQNQHFDVAQLLRDLTERNVGKHGRLLSIHGRHGCKQ
jgi:hypothetical protein